MDLLPTTYIFGGGNVSLTLAKMAKEVDFNVIVIDNEESFVHKERFPTVDKIIVDEYENVFNKLHPDESSYIVIMTRGHLHDREVLEWALKGNPKYIGMIGSKTRVQAHFSILQDKGVSKEVLDGVHAPIGLDINAQTPQEIAVSILAELIKVRRAKAVMGEEDKKKLHMEISGHEGEECG